MPEFLLHLSTPVGVEHAQASSPFADLEAAFVDIYAAIPDAAAGLLRRGVDPMGCSYLVHDEHDRFVDEVPFQELVGASAARPSPDDRDQNARTNDACRQARGIRARTQAECARSRQLCRESAALVARSRVVLDRRSVR